MFAKIFSQIFDSSIAEDYHCRRMFMDLLVLADSEGTVDMTIEAISRRTNVPIDEVKRCITELSQPDPSSRTKLHAGRRLVPLDSARDWGWQIVNYTDYRRMRDQEARREYFREQKRRQRGKTHVQDKKVDSGGRCQIVSSSSISSSFPKELQNDAFLRVWNEWESHRQEIKKPLTKTSREMQLQKLAGMGSSRAIAAIKHTIFKGWQGIQEPTSGGARPDQIRPVDPTKLQVAERFKGWVAEKYPEKREAAMKWQMWSEVPDYLRREWWAIEKTKLPVEA